MKKNVISLLFLVFLMSCAGAFADETTVVFIPKVTGNAFFEAANKGAQEYAARNGFKVSYEGSPEADAQNQLAIIDDAIRRRVGAICVSALDAAVLDTALKRAMRSGIKIVTWDSDAGNDARSLMVSQGTPDQLGRMLVEMGAKSLDSRGKNPVTETIKYVWHYSQPSVTDQNSWQAAGERYIKRNYPKWENVAPSNYYSMQDPQEALSVGTEIFKKHPDIDLVICNDSTSLPGQAAAAQNLGLSADDVTITGFASPNAMREFCKAGIVERWGLWDCKIQGAMGCYLAYYLASGETFNVGSHISIPEVGTVEVMPNTVLDPNAYVAPDSGVILMPKRTEFTKDNVDDYDF
jgi:AI-2 transport system substrate-binding protein